MNTPPRYLQLSATIYEALLERMERRTREAHIIEWARLIARFAWEHPPGRFADGRLEQPLLAIGRKLTTRQGHGLPRPPGQRFIIHVASHAPPIGGHIKLLTRWISRDQNSSHAIVLLDQGNQPAPPPLLAASQTRNNTLLVLEPGLDPLQRAARLRDLCQHADGIVLHTNPDDVTPLLAFAREGGPPIAIMNHADHVFWIGPSIAHTIINFRPFAVRHSKQRRYARSSPLLPLPIDIPRQHPRSPSRQHLGLLDDQVALLTIGSAYKFAPNQRHDFFRASHRILEQHPRARLLVMGPAPGEPVPGIEKLHPRATLLGIRTDPSPIQAAADLYLDHMPYGSLTAVLESTAAGLPPILMYDPPPALRFDDDPGFRGHITHPQNEDEYVQQASELIENPERRRLLADTIAPAMQSEHGGQGWLQALEDIYASFLEQPHAPQAIPHAPFQNEEVDRDMSRAAHARARPGPISLDIERDPPGPGDILALARHSWTIGDSHTRDLTKWLTRLRRSMRRRRKRRSAQ